MPKALFDFMGYVFYFYSNESDEPIHVHVSKGKTSENSAKFWIKRDTIELEYNEENIPKNDLKKCKNIFVQTEKQLLLDGMMFLACKGM